MWNEFLPISMPIYGDCGIGLLGHGVLLVFGAPCQLQLLVGQEHGRTIPLADFSGSVGFSGRRELYGRLEVRLVWIDIGRPN